MMLRKRIYCINILIVAMVADLSTSFVPTNSVTKIQQSSIITRRDLFDAAAPVSLSGGNSIGETHEQRKGDPLNNRHSASDWLYNVQSLPQSKVLREIRNPVMAVAGWSFIVSLIYRGLQSSTSSFLNALAHHMTIPGNVHSFLVSALGLLLVFRTNSAYQRFNEGRKIWENILSVSRNMSRMIHLYAKDVGPERRRRIINLVAAYPYLLRQHIRPGCLCSDKEIPTEHKLLLKDSRKFSPETRHEGQTNSDTTTPARQVCWVDKRELPWSLFMKSSLPGIAAAENRPLWVCDRIGALIAQIPYSPNFTSRERLALLGMVDKLTNAVGQCERIHQTAVPLNYARHSLRSLTLWLFTLPFALVKDLGLFTAPANAAIAWLFFGVYQIGYSIEDPFQGSLRLSILCDAIRRNVVGQAQDMRNSAFALDDEVDTDFDDSSYNVSSLYEKVDSVLLKEPLRLSAEDLFNAPKLIRVNGTWTEVGI